MEQPTQFLPPISSDQGQLSGSFLFPGIWLSGLPLTDTSLFLTHRTASEAVLILYCKSGRICWRPEGSGDLSLGPGEFSLCSLKNCPHSELAPLKEGSHCLLLWLDLTQLRRQPPQLLADSPVVAQIPQQLPLAGGQPVFFGADSRSDGIFRFFFDQPEALQPTYQKLKVLELLLYLHQAQPACTSSGQDDQMQIIRQIHEQLLHNLDKRVTIEELSRQYPMNPTTMKALFKTAYGTSLAAHMNEHRMEQAARLLLESDGSIAEIALAVGYDSPSKFSTAFKKYFHVLPKEYRKQRQ